MTTSDQLSRPTVDLQIVHIDNPQFVFSVTYAVPDGDTSFAEPIADSVICDDYHGPELPTLHGDIEAATDRLCTQLESGIRSLLLADRLTDLRIPFDGYDGSKPEDVSNLRDSLKPDTEGIKLAIARRLPTDPRLSSALIRARQIQADAQRATMAEDRARDHVREQRFGWS